MKSIMLHGLAVLLNAKGWVYIFDIGLCGCLRRSASPLYDHWVMGLCDCQPRMIRRSVSPKVFLTIVHAFICTRIEYCNSLLIGLPKTRLAPVQSVLNAAARMIARLPPYSHISNYMINE